MKKVIYADLDRTEGVVLQLETKNYYRLNETAQIVWQGLAAGKSAPDIARQIENDYQVPYDTALSDTNELISNFRRESLLDVDPSASVRPSVESARKSKKDAS